jgi:hydroxyethylthiazole kinase-like uncharacterized protein yjeF
MKKYQPNGNYLLMSRDDSRAFDAWAINTVGVPGPVLMENAGRSCAELICEILSEKKNPKVCIFCGTGNNGGDGFVIARHLFNHGFSPVVILCGQVAKVKGDAKINLDIIQNLGLGIEQADPADAENIQSRVAAVAGNCDMIVDAIFGTGLSGPLRGGHKLLIDAINSLNRPVLAVDIPSGLDCDTGLPLGAAINAKWTVTFVAVKKGFASGAAGNYTGDIFIASIGVEPRPFHPSKN